MLDCYDACKHDLELFVLCTAYRMQRAVYCVLHAAASEWVLQRATVTQNG